MLLSMSNLMMGVVGQVFKADDKNIRCYHLFLTLIVGKVPIFYEFFFGGGAIVLSENFHKF